MDKKGMPNAKRSAGTNSAKYDSRGPSFKAEHKKTKGKEDIDPNK